MVATARVCKQRKSDGSACGAPPLRDGPFCRVHDPDKSEEVAQARRLGGLRRRREKAVSGAYDLAGLGDIDSIRRLLEIAVVDTLELENSVARSRTLIAATMAAIRLLEVEAAAPRPILLEATAHTRRPFRAREPDG